MHEESKRQDRGLSILKPTLLDDKTKDELIKFVNPLAKASIVELGSNSLGILSITSEWIKYKAQSHITLFRLKNAKLLDIDLPQKDSVYSWETCFSDRIEGAIESHSNNLRTQTQAYFVDSPDFRIIRYYKYSGNLVGDSLNLGCTGFNLSDLSTYSDLSNQSNNHYYEDIIVRVNSSSLNIATHDNLIAFTTKQDKEFIHYIYKLPNGRWIQNKYKYPDNFKRFKFHQNVGLIFISDSQKEEKQLLCVDVLGNDNELFIIYFIIKFSSGETLKKYPKLLEIYRVDNDQDLDSFHMYSSKMFDLFKTPIHSELSKANSFQAQAFPNSIIRYNVQKNSLIIITLNRYIEKLFINSKKDEVTLWRIYEYVDQPYIIKEGDLSPDCEYFGFIAYRGNQKRIYLLHNQFHLGIDQNQLFILDFDHPSQLENLLLKDLKLFKTNEDNLVFVILIESGEIISYLVDTSITGGIGLFNLLYGEEFGDLILLAVISFVLALVLTRTTILVRRSRQGIRIQPL